jgi:quercetin dioxygenase-like cupin family protein
MEDQKRASTDARGKSYLVPRGAGLMTKGGLQHKVGAARTSAGLAILEGVITPGDFVPPHTHTREDEVSCVIRGKVNYRVGAETFEAAAGSYVIKPRGLVHAFWNASAEQATIIEVVIPGAFEEFFDAMDEVPDGPARPTALMALQERFEMAIDFNLAAEIAREHGLGNV